MTCRLIEGAKGEARGARRRSGCAGASARRRLFPRRGRLPRCVERDQGELCGEPARMGQPGSMEIGERGRGEEGRSGTYKEAAAFAGVEGENTTSVGIDCWAREAGRASAATSWRSPRTNSEREDALPPEIENCGSKTHLLPLADGRHMSTLKQKAPFGDRMAAESRMSGREDVRAAEG